jgi:hypothetical protein
MGTVQLTSPASVEAGPVPSLGASTLAAAKASFEKRRAGYEYKSRIPADHPPPLTYRDNP